MQKNIFLSAFLLLCISASLISCAPQQQPLNPPNHSDPIALDRDTFLANDGTILPVKSWLPQGNPKAVIVALHGFNDYSNAFVTRGIFFSRHNIALYAYDQRGFGKTANKGIWPGEDNLLRDVAECVRQAAHRHPHTPIYLLGESMGGALAVLATSDPTFPPINGIILEGPALWKINPLYHTTAWLVAHTVPFKTFTGSQFRVIASNNIPMLRRLGADPLIVKETRADTIYGLVHVMDHAYDAVPQVRVPVLLLYGDQDQIIPPDPIEKSLPRFTAPLRFAYYENGFHMLSRDIQGELVMQDMLSWIKDPRKPLPSGFDHGITVLERRAPVL